MGNSFAINSIGSYANDPFFLYALNSYNPSFMGANNTQQTQGANAPQQTQTVPETQATQVSPTFQGAEKEGSSTLKTLAIGTAIVGTAASIYAYSRGKKVGGDGIMDCVKKGFKDIFKSGKDKVDDVTGKLNNILQKGDKNVQEYTLQKDGMTMFFRKGEKTPYQIITDGKPVKGAKEIQDFLDNNTKLKDDISNLNFNNALPKDVSIISAARREVTNADGKKYEIVFDEAGKFKEIFEKDANDKLTKVENISDDLKDLISKNSEFTEKLGNKINLKVDNTKVIKANKVELISKDGKLYRIKYKHGGNEFDITGKDLEEFIERNKNIEIADYISKTGKLNHGIDPKDCVFEYRNQKGIAQFKWNKDKPDYTEVREIKPLTTTKEVDDILDANDKAIRNALENGNIPEGFNNGYTIIKGTNGHTFKIENNEIKNVKLNETWNNHSEGDLIIDKDEIKKWCEAQASNNNEYQAMLELLK